LRLNERGSKIERKGEQTMRGPKAAVLSLSKEEREVVNKLVRRHSTPHQLLLRGRIVLGAAGGKSNGEISPRSGSGDEPGKGVTDALDRLSSRVALRIVSGGVTVGSVPPRATIRDQRPTNLSVGGDGV